MSKKTMSRGLQFEGSSASSGDGTSSVDEQLTFSRTFSNLLWPSLVTLLAKMRSIVFSCTHFFCFRATREGGGSLGDPPAFETQTTG